MPKKGPCCGTAWRAIMLKWTRGDRAGFRREARAGLKLSRRWWLCIIEGPLGCPRGCAPGPPIAPRISSALSPLLRSPGCERRTAPARPCAGFFGDLSSVTGMFSGFIRDQKRREKKTFCHRWTDAPAPSPLLLALSSQAPLSAAAWAPSRTPARRPRPDARFHPCIFDRLLSNFFFLLLSILTYIRPSN